MSHESTFQGITSAHLTQALPEAARPAFRKFLPYLAHGVHWRWIGGREHLTAAGIEAAAKEMEAAGHTSAAVTLRRELRQALDLTARRGGAHASEEDRELVGPGIGIERLVAMGAAKAEREGADSAHDNEANEPPYWWQREDL